MWLVIMHNTVKMHKKSLYCQRHQPQVISLTIIDTRYYRLSAQTYSNIIFCLSSTKWSNMGLWFKQTKKSLHNSFLSELFLNEPKPFIKHELLLSVFKALFFWILGNKLVVYLCQSPISQSLTAFMRLLPDWCVFLQAGCLLSPPHMNNIQHDTPFQPVLVLILSHSPSGEDLSHS